MSTIATSDRLDYQRGVQSEPLTERDIQLVHRYLSDPAVFPREFKEWVTNHASDTVDIAKTQVHGLVNGSGQIVIGSASMGILGATLCGVIVPYAAVAAPEGWLLCDGSERLRTEFATLFNLIGTSWGTPSDSTKFKLPDLRGRAPYGSDGGAPFGGSDGKAAGARGHTHAWQVESDVNSYAENSTRDIGGHQHGGAGGPAMTDYAGSHGHSIFVSVWGHVSAGGQTGPTVGGWVGVNYIIGSGVVPA